MTTVAIYWAKKFVFIIPVLFVVAIVIFALTTKHYVLASDASCQTKEYTGLYDHSATQALFEGKEIDRPLFARNVEEETNTAVLGVATPSERWVEVDLSEQKLKAWDGNTLYMETPISSGLPGTPTPTGEFRIWVKLRYTKMEGGRGRYYYNLPNVPYTMFFSNDKVPSWKGYGLHGTYWHNSFGTPRSHGCVNLPTPMAEKLYYFVGPSLPDGKKSVYADENNQGTRVLIHE